MDLDIGGYRLKDRIIWNLKDDYLSSNEFAAILCHDLNLPLEQFRDQISEAIDEQLDDYKEILDNEIQLNLFKTKEINGATIPITVSILTFIRLLCINFKLAGYSCRSFAFKRSI